MDNLNYKQPHEASDTNLSINEDGHFKHSLIEISAKAIIQLKKIFAEDHPGEGKGLRLGVVGGGCSGLSYKMDFGDEKEKDNVIILENIKILIDPKSAIYLKGILLDYQDGLNGKGFVFQNPNAKNTCGCGESFSV